MRSASILCITEYNGGECDRTKLQAFDEKLRHYADMHISLDLDDGAKVNYGKFGDLLAQVEAVCGKDED